MLASLGGLDALVFTAGVGENSAEVRDRVCQAFRFLKLELDSTLNREGRGDRDIAALISQIRVLVIHTQEDWQIAMTCWQHLSRLSQTSSAARGL
ncbi:MAG: acetate kinase, partial [Cyanobacteria bacterium J06639_1]